MTLAKIFLRLFVRWWAVLGLLGTAYYAYLAIHLSLALGSQQGNEDTMMALCFGAAMGAAISAVPAAAVTAIHILLRNRVEA
ncbi:hypothetical protein E4K72_19825 [Oxalobacteraceae bacterium OM1]|nr:hypothetical protein E4K72_19825 [Oxalobacteraceae bacterium OM1]